MPQGVALLRRSRAPKGGGMILGILYLAVLFAMFKVLMAPGCSSCGRKLVHADDCWRKR